jgi:2-aminoadipate transaminase
MDWGTRYADRTRFFRASSIRELLKLTTNPEMISFAGGLPATEALPIQAVTEACDCVLRALPDKALQYGPTEGCTALREQIAALYQKQGVPVTVENVLITTGSQQGLDLIGRTLVDHGDRLVVDTPTYIGALQAWRPCQPTFIGLPLDAGGMQIEQLDLNQPTKFVYVLPNFQNPTGVSLAEARRHTVVALAHQHDFVIVEDDPYRALRYSGADLPSLLQIEAQMLGASWNANGRIVHLGTLSKVMAPGLRVGWIVAPTPVLRMLAIAKQGADLHSASLNQYIAAELLRDGIIEANYPKLIEIYRERRDAMFDALDASIGGAGTWTHPDGGLFIWLTLDGIDTRELLTRALENKVAFVPGRDFYFDDRGVDSMRLNFSCMPPEKIHEGIARIGQLIAHEQREVIPAYSLAG